MPMEDEADRVYRGDFIDFEVWGFALDSVIPNILCVLELCAIFGFSPEERPQFLVTIPDHCATMQVGILYNDAFVTHRATELDGQV